MLFYLENELSPCMFWSVFCVRWRGYEGLGTYH